MTLNSGKHKDLHLEQKTTLQKQLRSNWLSSSPAKKMFVTLDAKLKDNNAFSPLNFKLKLERSGQQFEGSYSSLLLNRTEDISAILSPVLFTPPAQEGHRETQEGQVDEQPESEQPRAHEL